MTTDELVTLVEAFIGDTTVSDIRCGDTTLTDVLDDAQFILLMRFMAGERPSPTPTVPGGYIVGAPMNTEVKYYDRPLPFDVDDDDGAGGARVEPNEFSGITLP